MKTEWFYKPIEGYNRRYIRVGEFHQIRWCETHGYPSRKGFIHSEPADECLGASGHNNCNIVDKWLEV